MTSSPTATSSSTSTKELVESYDAYVLVDTSASMSGPAKAGNPKSRHDSAREAVEGFCYEVSKYDSDGITIAAFDSRVHDLKHNTTPEKMEETYKHIKASGSSTATDLAINEIWKHHKSHSAKKGLLFIFTDGQPNDKDAVANAIKLISNSLPDASQFRIQFVQVGEDESATAWLDTLDNDLKGVKWDIVNSLTLEKMCAQGFEESIRQAVLDTH